MLEFYEFNYVSIVLFIRKVCFFVFIIFSIININSKKIESSTLDQIKVHVFFDKNQNGYKEDREFGVGSVEVKFNGKSCLTDFQGNCYFDLTNNNTSVFTIKILKPSRIKNFIFTTEQEFVLLPDGEKKDLHVGVSYNEKNIYLSLPPKLKLKVNSYFAYQKLRIEGNTISKNLKINNKIFKPKIIDCEIIGSEIVEKNHSRFIFRTMGEGFLKKWKFLIFDESGNIVFEDIGSKSLPKLIHWGGKDRFSRNILPNSRYYYQLIATFDDYNEVWTSVKDFIVAGEKLFEVSLGPTGVKFTGIAIDRLKDIDQYTNQNESIILIEGAPYEANQVRKIILKELRIAPDRVILEKSLRGVLGGVRIKIFISPTQKGFSAPAGVLVDGIKFNPLQDGRFNFFVSEVPINKNLRIDMNCSDGSRLVFNLKLPETDVFQKYSYDNIEREFRNISRHEGKFEFIMPVSGGSYDKTYELFDTEGELVINKKDTLLRFKSEIGKSKFMFQIRDAMGKTIDLFYIVESYPLSDDKDNNLLFIFIPEYHNDQYNNSVFIRGITNSKNKVLINGKDIINEYGKFYSNVRLTNYKNKIYFNIINENKQNQSSHINLNANRLSIFKKIKAKAFVYLGFNDFRQKENSSKKGYNKSNFFTFKLKGAVFPLNAFSEKNNFFDFLGIEFSHQMPLTPLSVFNEDTGIKRTLNGPKISKINFVYDPWNSFFKLKPSVRLGKGYYKLKFSDDNFYENVDFGSKYFVALNLGLSEKSLFYKFSTDLEGLYYFPSKGITGYELGFRLSREIFNDLKLNLEYSRKFFKNNSGVKEVLGSIFLGFGFNY